MFKGKAWVFLVMAILGPIAGFFMAGVITYVMPKKYEAETVIEVKPRLPSPDSGIPGGPQMTPQFFATEFEKIKSRKSLVKVIDRLDLTSHWNVDQETAIRMLKAIVNTQNIRGTDLISIRVRHINKMDVRDIANGVAFAYRDYRKEIEIRDAESRLKELNKAVRDQEDKVEERRKKLAAIVREKGILDQGAGASENPQALEPETPPQDAGKPGPAESERDGANRRGMDAQDYVDAKSDYETDREQLQQSKLKMIAETVNLKAPSQSVAVHDEAVIPEMPVSPSVVLNLVLGLAGGFLLSPLMALLVIGLMGAITKPAVER